MHSINPKTQFCRSGFPEANISAIISLPMTRLTDSFMTHAQRTQMAANGVAQGSRQNIAVERQWYRSRRSGGAETLTLMQQRRCFFAALGAESVVTRLLLQAGCSKQRGRSKSEGFSNPGQIDECDVVHATLDAPHVRPV